MNLTIYIYFADLVQLTQNRNIVFLFKVRSIYAPIRSSSSPPQIHSKYHLNYRSLAYPPPQRSLDFS